MRAMRALLVALLVAGCFAEMGGKGRRGGGMSSGGTFFLSTGSNRAGNSEDESELLGDDSALDNAPDVQRAGNHGGFTKAEIRDALGADAVAKLLRHRNLGGQVVQLGDTSSTKTSKKGEEETHDDDHDESDVHKEEDDVKVIKAIKATNTKAGLKAFSSLVSSEVKRVCGVGKKKKGDEPRACLSYRAASGLSVAEQKALFKMNPGCSWDRWAIVTLHQKKRVAKMIEKIYQIFHLVASYVYPLEEKLPNFKCVERVFSGASWKATGKLAAHRYHKGNNWGRNLKDDESMTKACCKGRPMKTCRQIHREGKARKRWYGSISESVFCPKGRDSKMCTQSDLDGDENELGASATDIVSQGWGSRRRRSRARRRRSFFRRVWNRGSRVVKKVAKRGGGLIKKLAKGPLIKLLIPFVKKLLRKFGLSELLGPVKLLLKGKAKQAASQTLDLLMTSIRLRKLVRHNIIQRIIFRVTKEPYIVSQTYAKVLSQVLIPHTKMTVRVVPKLHPYENYVCTRKIDGVQHTARKPHENLRGHGPLVLRFSQVVLRRSVHGKPGDILCQMEVKFDFLFCNECNIGKVNWSPTDVHQTQGSPAACQRWFVFVDKYARGTLGQLQAMNNVDILGKKACRKRLGTSSF